MPDELGWQELILIGVAGAVLGGLLLWSLKSLVRRSWRYWQARQVHRQEERLLRAFLEMAAEQSPHDKLNVLLHGPSVAKQRAKLQDHEPVLERLVSKGHIRPDRVYPNHYYLTFEGRKRVSGK